MANFSMIPKDVFERGIIRMTEGGIITMPDKDVWMTVDEIADMLFVPSAVVFRTIRACPPSQWNRPPMPRFSTFYSLLIGE